MWKGDRRIGCEVPQVGPAPRPEGLRRILSSYTEAGVFKYCLSWKQKLQKTGAAEFLQDRAENLGDLD